MPPSQVRPAFTSNADVGQKGAVIKLRGQTGRTKPSSLGWVKMHFGPISRPKFW